MSVSPLDYLRHVRDEAHYLAEEAARTTKLHFDQNETAKRAFVRSIEIIGEAANLGASVELPMIRIPVEGERYRFLPNGKGLVYMQAFKEGLTPQQHFWLLDLAVARQNA